jgi:transketolase
MSEQDLRDIFGEFLVKIGQLNENVVVLDSDLSSSTRTNIFAKKYPERFFNMGIAEQNMLGTALGFAISGKVPVVSGFSIFTLGRAWEFIRLACHDNLNIKIITTHSGFVGGDGSTHNALEDLSLLCSLPNLNILNPSDNIELREMLEYVFNAIGPFYIRLPRGSFPKIHDESYRFSIGKPDVIRDGDDICLLGTGYGTTLALNSAPSIEKKLDISIKVINLSSVKPININELIKEISYMKGIVTLEEHNIYCGFGSILARIISEHIPMPMKFIGVEESFGQSGSREKLLDFYGLNEMKVLEKIKHLLISARK